VTNFSFSYDKFSTVIILSSIYYLSNDICFSELAFLASASISLDWSSLIFISISSFEDKGRVLVFESFLDYSL
jgi:hypothetical protein